MHGMQSLLEGPIPALVHEVINDPYENPNNPPEDPEKITGFCGVQFTINIDPKTGLKKYRLVDFPSEKDVIRAGFNITHQGHCGGDLKLSVKVQIL